MDELGLFFETLPNKGLVEKIKSSRSEKQSKKSITIAVFVAASGSKPCNPVVIWRSQLPRRFRKLTVPTRPFGLYYFTNAKSQMNTEIKEYILGRLDSQLKLENRHVILFPDNAPSHPKIFQDPLEFIELVFLPKLKTSKI